VERRKNGKKKRRGEQDDKKGGRIKRRKRGWIGCSRPDYSGPVGRATGTRPEDIGAAYWRNQQ
jgi:hypothetical protein